ncbi:MAG TPA: alpha-glucosidase [Terriglobales bacterium]|nr:alpha-glucosidase [Terriglobales bacterium]
MSKRSFLIGALLLIFNCSLLSVAQTKSVDAEGHQWWQHAVFYEIYPRSFADSNNDGVGDLKGITSKMAYLHDLGVDAIWISPCFPSPQVDFGYDVSDYENIDPMYGTLADFDRMVAEGKKHKVSIVLDFVVNHTSDQHPWFADSKSAKTAAHRDWYIWRDGKGPDQPPNNWISTFGGSAWKLDPTTNQYYYHFFYAGQPDLNWRNPAVEKAMLDVTRWWYKRGAVGFRLDAVDTLFEDPDLKDNPILPGSNKLGDPNHEDKYNTKLPEVYDVMHKLRQIADEFGAVLIGETGTKDIEELKRYYNAGGKGLQMPMDFMFTGVDKLSPPEFRRQIALVDASGGWPVYVISNHDRVRSYNRYGDGKNNDAIAKMMAAFYLTLRGSPIMYYGEELGMENNDPKRKEDVKDPIGRTGWPNEIGRDGERTPMQWNTEKNAGFSTKDPWLPVPPSFKTHNVATESKDPNSVLSMYKKVLALRHTNPALREGGYTALNEEDDNVMSYLRSYKGKAVLVALNMSASPQKATFNLADKGFPSANLKSLIATPHSSGKGSEVTLEPFGVFIAEISK